MTSSTNLLSLDQFINKILVLVRILYIFPLNFKSGSFSISKWRLLLTLVNCFLHLLFTALCNIVYRINETSSVVLLMQILFIVISCFILSWVYTMVFFYDSLNSILTNIHQFDLLLLESGYEVKNKISLVFTYFHLIGLMLCGFLDNEVFQDGLFRTTYYYWSYSLVYAIHLLVVGVLELVAVRFQLLCSKLRRPNIMGGAAQMLRLAQAKDLLSNTVSIINETFSPLFLFISSLIFILFLDSLFFIAIYAVNGFPGLGLISVLLFWIFFALTSLIRITKRTFLINKKAKEFNNLLYQVMINDMTDELSNNKKLRLHVAMKREVALTACGYFNLDYTLVHSMMAAATTYLVILIQFWQSNSTPTSSPATQPPVVPVTQS